LPLEDYGITNSVLDVFEKCDNIEHMALTVECFLSLICATSPDTCYTGWIGGLQALPLTTTVIFI
jgi:hypothetical protein